MNMIDDYLLEADYYVVTCFLLFGGLVFLFPPTRFLSSPSPFSFDTSVSWTSVQGTSVPLSFSHKFNSQLYRIQYMYQVSRVQIHDCFTACMAKPTAWKRSCGEKYHRKFPIFKKMKRVRLPARVSKFMVSLHTSYMAANVGPKAQ